MNVLHINQSDIGGGAAIAGYRLHQGLLKQGINSKLMVGWVETDSELVAAVSRKYRLENQLSRVTNSLGLNYLNLISTFDIFKHNFYTQADVINFHNLHTGYFNYLAIPGLTESKPAIFTLHDMWSFTGHCSYSYDCDRWQRGCGECPYPETYPAIARDNTHIEWKLKNWVYSKSHLSIVTPSQWLTEQAKKSMLSRFPIYYIPNGIDTDAYQPLNAEKCREILGIPANKKVLMFGAHLLQESRKGGDLLVKALQNLPEALKSEILLLILGKASEKFGDLEGIPTLKLGYVSSDRLKSIAYSAADLFIFPTRADNLPLVLQESMACGTPMISFKVGGVPELVRPGITGYLAQLEDTQDLSNGIVQLLEDSQLRQKMGENCRAIALQEYTLDLQIQRYLQLYQQVVGKIINTIK
ncbi:glycosyltransferase family 4 protein [Nostoc sp. CCY 9925]|uniref:glycosyltransferase family 4 protein n=1 Tax=Nostoc sp. CCY 9925 TaxID=3103865 RepID=UPI0039C69712